MVHILVVDDDASLREVMAEFLEAAGHRLETAANGDEALERMRRQRPDVILLDLEMPVMDGWAVLRSCRGVPELAEVPVIVMSAARDALATLGDLAINRYLPKPFDLDQLAMAVGEAVSPSMTANGRCAYCNAENPSRTLRVFSKKQPLGRWQLCERCWRFLEIGFSSHYRDQKLDRRLDGPIPVHAVEARAWIRTGLQHVARRCPA